MEESKLEWDGMRLTLIVKNSNMDFDEKIRKIALEDKTLGLFHGKLGACIYFYVSSNHDEDSLACQTAKELLVQIVQKVSSVKSIDFDNGVMGLSLGLSFLMKNNYVEDTSISWLSRMDNYVYKVAVKTLDMDIKDNDFLYQVDILVYEVIRYNELKDNYKKELCLRLIKALFNQIYLNRPVNFFSEAIPFTIHDRLISFLFVLLEIRRLGICVPRIDRIFKEMKMFLFSLVPILNPNRYSLYLVSSLVAQVTDDIEWMQYAERLKKSVDMEGLFTKDMYDMSILPINGISGMVLLIFLYNRYSNNSISIDLERVEDRLESSLFWKRFQNDVSFMKKYYSLNGYCGIRLLLDSIKSGRNEI